jgi:hypothetical protein
MIALRLAALWLSLSLAAGAAGPSTPPGLHSIIALLPKGQINRPYPATALLAGGTPPYSAQTTAGALPPGMSFSSAGALYGTPRETGTFRFKLDITDSTGLPLELSYTLQIGR